MTVQQVIYRSPQGGQAILAHYDTLLAQWPLPYQTHLLPTRHGRTFVLASGPEDAPPLILLHGSSANSAMWIGDVTAFARHYRVYAVDLPGEPGKSEPIRHELTGPAYAEWMEDLFAALHIQRAVVMGISLGGWMALRFATLHPQRVEKLVLLCPAGVAPVRRSFLPFAVMMTLLGDWGLERIVRRLNGGQPVASETAWYIKLIAKNFNPRMEEIPLFSDAELARLEMPLLLVTGEYDSMISSRQTMQRVQRLLPHARALMLPAGHMLINLNQPVLSFLVGAG